MKKNDIETHSQLFFVNLWVKMTTSTFFYHQQI